VPSCQQRDVGKWPLEVQGEGEGVCGEEGGEGGCEDGEEAEDGCDGVAAGEGPVEGVGGGGGGLGDEDGAVFGVLQVTAVRRI